jgi:hypothetical protein
MLKQQLFFHSPLDQSSIKQKETPSLLLQLIFKELIIAQKYLKQTDPSNFAPFIWSSKPGNKNKIKEYILLLKLAFPKLQKEIKDIVNNLDKPCQEISSKLEPFIFHCKDNESLLFFLIKHQKHLNIKSILHTISPKGIDSIKKEVAIKYKKRGFNILKWTP